LTLASCRIIELPRITDPRGNLTFIESNRHVPFEIKRTYYLYDVPGGESRGGHAHYQLQEFIIAASGSFDVIVDDGNDRKNFFLNRSYFGLYVPHMIWRELQNFSSGPSASCSRLSITTKQTISETTRHSYAKQGDRDEGSVSRRWCYLS
jgi:hypothetical protein